MNDSVTSILGAQSETSPDSLIFIVCWVPNLWKSDFLVWQSKRNHSESQIALKWYLLSAAKKNEGLQKWWRNTGSHKLVTVPIISTKILSWEISVTTPHNNCGFLFRWNIVFRALIHHTTLSHQPFSDVLQMSMLFFLTNSNHFLCASWRWAMLVFPLAWGNCSFRNSPKGMNQIRKTVKMRLKSILLGKWLATAVLWRFAQLWELSCMLASCCFLEPDLISMAG